MVNTRSIYSIFLNQSLGIFNKIIEYILDDQDGLKNFLQLSRVNKKINTHLKTFINKANQLEKAVFIDSASIEQILFDHINSKYQTNIDNYKKDKLSIVPIWKNYFDNIATNLHAYNNKRLMQSQNRNKWPGLNTRKGWLNFCFDCLLYAIFLSSMILVLLAASSASNSSIFLSYYREYLDSFYNLISIGLQIKNSIILAIVTLIGVIIGHIAGFITTGYLSKGLQELGIFIKHNLEFFFRNFKAEGKLIKELVLSEEWIEKSKEIVGFHAWLVKNGFHQKAKTYREQTPFTLFHQVAKKAEVTKKQEHLSDIENPSEIEPLILRRTNR